MQPDSLTLAASIASVVASTGTCILSVHVTNCRVISLILLIVTTTDNRKWQCATKTGNIYTSGTVTYMTEISTANIKFFEHGRRGQKTLYLPLKFRSYMSQFRRYKYFRFRQPFPIVGHYWNRLGHFFLAHRGRKPRVCRINFDNIYHTF